MSSWSRPLSYRPIATAALAVLGLAGCATPPAPPAPTEDVNVGIARSCTFTPVTPVPGGAANSTITMTNDGWCAVRVTERDGQPFLLGLVRQRPEHGRVLIEKLGGQSRLEYTADPGYVGQDRFSAALRSRNGATPDAAVEVAVTVNAGQAVAPVAAPTPQQPERPTRRTTRRPTRRKPSR